MVQSDRQAGHAGVVDEPGEAVRLGHAQQCLVEAGPAGVDAALVRNELVHGLLSLREAVVVREVIEHC